MLQPEDNTCLDTNKAQIYFYAPAADRSRVAVWENPDMTFGFVTVDLMPRWWNSSTSMNLTVVPPYWPRFYHHLYQPYFWPSPPAANTSIQTSSVLKYINMQQ